MRKTATGRWGAAGEEVVVRSVTQQRSKRKWCQANLPHCVRGANSVSRNPDFSGSAGGNRSIEPGCSDLHVNRRVCVEIPVFPASTNPPTRGARPLWRACRIDNRTALFVVSARSAGCGRTAQVPDRLPVHCCNIKYRKDLRGAGWRAENCVANRFGICCWLVSMPKDRCHQSEV